MAHITTGVEESLLVKAVFNMGVENLRTMTGEEIYYPESFLVFLNGKLPFFPHIFYGHIH
jgi:DNA-directed RNA polymerase III subunit RPC2